MQLVSGTSRAAKTIQHTPASFSISRKFNDSPLCMYTTSYPTWVTTSMGVLWGTVSMTTPGSRAHPRLHGYWRPGIRAGTCWRRSHGEGLPDHTQTPRNLSSRSKETHNVWSLSPHSTHYCINALIQCKTLLHIGWRTDTLSASFGATI